VIGTPSQARRRITAAAGRVSLLLTRRGPRLRAVRAAAGRAIISSGTAYLPTPAVVVSGRRSGVLTAL
jgi:hypothetical protein